MLKTIGLVLMAGVMLAAFGCEAPPKPYGTEHEISWAGKARQVWAIAPAIDLSGMTQVDPYLQADIVYQQLQAVDGITVIPVNRVAAVYGSLGIDKVSSEDQASLVCELLGCDGLIVPTITAYDPYAPPKFGASLQLFGRKHDSDQKMDSKELERRARGNEDDASLPRKSGFVQAVGMYDSANGSVREAVLQYAYGRNDPMGPLGSKEYFVSMDRYCGFVYHNLIVDLIRQARKAKD